MDDTDPLDPLDALEQSIEQERTADNLLHGPDDFYTDDTARALDALEANIEKRAFPPPEVFEPETPFLVPPLVAPAVGGPVSDGPPLPPEPGVVPWTELRPPQAARPRMGRGGHGRSVGRPYVRESPIFRTGFSARLRLCPETNEFVKEDDCESCEQFRDWSEDGSGPECYHDWVERQEGEDE